MKKNNLVTISLVLTILAIFSLGCGMLGSSKIPNEQLSKDLEAKTIADMSVKSGMRLSKDVVAFQCFNVLESKLDGDSGEVTVDLFTSAAGNSFFGMGTVILTYKKDGEKWVIDKATPKDYNVTQPKDDSDSRRVAEKGAKLCAIYENKINKN